jgi:copper chaperone CopZ
MASLELTIPALWADHHVTKVKRLLAPLPGVEDVLASSAFKAVVIEYDETKTNEQALVKALTDAGYAPGELPVVERQPDRHFDPAWENLGAPVRVTVTNQVDLQLSGEFRKY